MILTAITRCHSTLQLFYSFIYFSSFTDNPLVLYLSIRRQRPMCIRDRRGVAWCHTLEAYIDLQKDACHACRREQNNGCVCMHACMVCIQTPAGTESKKGCAALG